LKECNEYCWKTENDEESEESDEEEESYDD
jgi:hypothetical protein